jgi:aspartyl-tRNA(Asn)/glutamyl-tRNA(Gln) amidotransferase subunit C
VGDVLDVNRIRHLALLAGLSLDDEESASFAEDLRRIVAYVQQLAEVSTLEVDGEVDGAVGGGSGGLREDVVTPGLSREDALAAAPRASDGGFAVPGFVTGTR